jgi:DNA-binding CsgD family transcriptional regulator
MMELWESLLSRLGYPRAKLYERWQLLSPREQEVTALPCQGYTNRQMAARLIAFPPEGED